MFNLFTHLLCFFSFCYFVSTNTLASEKNLPPLLLLSDDGPPHMIQATESGIDIDITKGVLNLMKREVHIAFSPLKRNKQQVINKKADLFVPTFYQNDSKNIFISDPIIEYKPTVFSLKSNDFIFDRLSDIQNLNVISFQGATGYFNTEFVEMTKKNNYREVHDMSKIPEMLLAKRVDIVVLDYYIFYYYLHKMPDNKKFNLHQLISQYSLIPTVNAHVGFNDLLLRNKFNHYLKLFIAQKEDEKIIANYIGDNP